MLKHPALDMKNETDCDMIDVCTKINNATYSDCEAGSMIGTRCSVGEKTIIMALSKINEKLDSN